MLMVGKSRRVESFFSVLLFEQTLDTHESDELEEVIVVKGNLGTSVGICHLQFPFSILDHQASPVVSEGAVMRLNHENLGAF